MNRSVNVWISLEQILKLIYYEEWLRIRPITKNNMIKSVVTSLLFYLKKSRNKSITIRIEDTTANEMSIAYSEFI